MDFSIFIYIYLVIGAIVQIILVETHPRKKKVFRNFNTWKRILLATYRGKGVV